MGTPRPASNNRVCPPTWTSVLGPNRVGRGAGEAVPRSVTVKSLSAFVTVAVDMNAKHKKTTNNCAAFIVRPQNNATQNTWPMCQVYKIATARDAKELHNTGFVRQQDHCPLWVISAHLQCDSNFRFTPNTDIPHKGLPSAARQKHYLPPRCTVLDDLVHSQDCSHFDLSWAGPHPKDLSHPLAQRHSRMSMQWPKADISNWTYPVIH